MEKCKQQQENTSEVSGQTLAGILTLTTLANTHPDWIWAQSTKKCRPPLLFLLCSVGSPVHGPAIRCNVIVWSGMSPPICEDADTASSDFIVTKYPWVLFRPFYFPVSGPVKRRLTQPLLWRWLSFLYSLGFGPTGLGCLKVHCTRFNPYTFFSEVD